jgi:uncharacterized protein with HEPN domain
VPRAILLCLFDIRDAIGGIQHLATGVAFDTFADDWAMQRAVERGLEIISKASRHVPGDLKAVAPDVPRRQIAAIGNLLRHEYRGLMSRRHGISSRNTSRRLPPPLTF